MSAPIQIDPEFAAYVPPLSDEERAQLEANLKSEGCLSPLVVWDGVLVDGHNRFEICSRLGITFDVVHRYFRDREAALDWMDAHQLGRRNLSPDARRLLLGRRYNRVKGAQGGDHGNQYTVAKCQTDPLPETAAGRLAVEHGVSEATVKRAGKFAAEVDADESLRAAVVAGQSVAAIRRERAESSAEGGEVPIAANDSGPIDPERRKLAKLTTEALIDDVLGLRASLDDEKAKVAALKAEKEDLTEKLATATSGEQGRVIGQLQRQLDQLKGRIGEHQTAAKRWEYRAKKAEARVQVLERREGAADEATAAAAQPTRQMVVEAFDAWNALAGRIGLPVAKDLTETRRKAIAARLAIGGMEAWREALSAVEASDHCRGENDRGWRADIDFVTTASKFQKLREGSYGAAQPAPVAAQPAASFDGPPDLRAAIVRERDEDYARRWLDHYCRWRPADRTLLARSPLVASTLTRDLADWLARAQVRVEVDAAGSSPNQTRDAA